MPVSKKILEKPRNWPNRQGCNFVEKLFPAPKKCFKRTISIRRLRLGPFPALKQFHSKVTAPAVRPIFVNNGLFPEKYQNPGYSCFGTTMLRKTDFSSRKTKNFYLL